jgi:hypothetical protein
VEKEKKGGDADTVSHSSCSNHANDRRNGVCVL